MSGSPQNAKVILLTGGAWWGDSSPVNVGHYFVKEAIQRAFKEDRPLRLYICTRTPPPSGELERFVRSNQELTMPGPELASTLAAHHIALRHLPLDLLNPYSVRDCASRFLSQESRLNVLVLNAAIAPNQREPSGWIASSLEGRTPEQSSKNMIELEKAMMTNVIGTSMLAKALEPAMVKAAEEATHHDEKPRIALVSSELHRRLGDLEVTPQTIRHLVFLDQWNGMQTYKLTKLVQTIWLYALQRELGDDIDCVAISPGFIPSTSLSRASPYAAQLFMSYFLHFMPFASNAEEGGRKVYQGSMESIKPFCRDNQARAAIYLKNGEPVSADSRVYDECLGQDWKRWIEHAVATVTTPIADLVPKKPNVLIVGGTAGIGAALARKLAWQLPTTSHITIAGRNSEAAAAVIADIRQHGSVEATNSSGVKVPVGEFAPVDCASMSDVKRFCAEYRQRLEARQGSLDILILTPGILSLKGWTPATSNSTIDRKMALHFYARMLIIRELGPVLSKEAIVMSVLDGKHSDAYDKAIIWNDLPLSQPGHYGLRSAMRHSIVMTDVMMQYFATRPDAEHSATFVHAYPGFVATSTSRNPALPLVVRLGLGLLSRLFASSPGECAERLLKGMVHAQRLAISDSCPEGRWLNLDRDMVVRKRPVDEQIIERVQKDTWRLIDGQATGA